MPTYSVQVEPGKEFYMADMLSMVFRSKHPEIACRLFVPTIPWYMHNTADEAKKAGSVLTLVRKTMFPGYVFVETNQIRDFNRAFGDWVFESWYRLLGKEVDSFLPLDDEELQWIRLLSSETLNTAVIKEGKLVFLSGPLMGREEAVRKVRAGRNCVCLELPFKGKAKRIWLAVDIGTC